MAAVFVSYRRDDSGGYASRLADALQDRFGADAVFRDVDSLRAGRSFEAALAEKLAECGAMLVVMSKQYATIADGAGRLRLAAPDDWVRREVEEGLARKIPVIPVLVGGAALPAASALPDSLKPLLSMQAVELRDGRAWDHDVALLAGDVEALLAGRLRGRRLVRALLRHARWAVPLAAAAAAAIVLWPRPAPEPPAAESDPRFDLVIDDRETCFTRDAAGGPTDAEIALRLTPAMKESDRIGTAFVGIAKVFDAAAVPPDFDPAGAPCAPPACLGIALWDDAERPTLVRGGTEGTVVRFHAILPAKVERIVVFGRFYQREGAQGTQCVADASRPYEKGTQLPFLVRVDAAGKVVAKTCDGAFDTRHLPVPPGPGRRCLR